MAKLFKLIGGGKGVSKRYGSAKTYNGIRNDGGAERLTKMDLIMYALNLGNEQNADRVANEMDIDALGAVLVQELTTDEWKFVQATFDYIDSFWDEANKNYRNLTGLRSQKVEAKVMINGAPEFVTGGYFPLKYDPQISGVGSQNERQAALLEGKGNHSVKAMTKMGSMKERAKSVKDGRILLDPSIIYNHVWNVLHDIELGEAIQNASNIIYSPEFFKSLAANGRPQDVEYLKN